VSVACALQALCVGAAAMLVLRHDSLIAIAALAAARSAVGTAPRPALVALMPALADSPEQLTRATALWGACDNGGFLLGGVGAIAIAAVGTGTVVAVSAALIAVAAVLAASLPAVTATELDGGERESAVAGVLAGMRAVTHARQLRAPFVLFLGLLLLQGTTNVQFVALAISHLRMGDGGPGAIYAIYGGAGALAGIVLLWVVRRRGYGAGLAAGGFAFALGLAVCGLGGVAMALVAMIPVGVGFTLVETGVIALVPRLADDAIVGRVYGFMEFIYAGAEGAGALIAPGLISALGTAGSLVGSGALYALLTALVLPDLARLDTGQEQAGRVRELLRGIPFLAPLPLPRLERLVQDAKQLLAPAGTVIIRAGDPGDAFFAIEQGEVEVVEVGRRQGPGTGFGEIALLRDVPRTATVRAAIDSELWTLTRRTFVAAVTRPRGRDGTRRRDRQRAPRTPAHTPGSGGRPGRGAGVMGGPRVAAKHLATILPRHCPMSPASAAPARRGEAPRRPGGTDIARQR
jgi:hypothetical protein